MRVLKLTGQFKKDLKRYKHNAPMLEDLERVLRQLKQNGKVDEKHLHHSLTGNYKGLHGVSCPDRFPAHLD